MTNQGIIYPQLSQGVLTPAYGRNPKTKAQAIKSFRSGEDWRVNWSQGSTYCSIRDAVIGEMVKLRYDSGKKALFYTITAQDFVKS